MSKGKGRAMTPEELQEYQALCLEIECLERRRAEKLDMAQRMGQRYSRDRVKGGRRADAEIIIAEAAEIGREITAELRLRKRQAAEIEKYISSVSSSRMRRLLRLRYLSVPPLTWEQIGREMGYSTSRVWALHNEFFKGK